MRAAGRFVVESHGHITNELMFASGRPDIWGIYWEKSVPKPGKN